MLGMLLLVDASALVYESKNLIVILILITLLVFMNEKES